MSVFIERKRGVGVFAGIYKITSPTGRVYIGQSWNILDRWRSYQRLACTDQPALYNSLKKHGVPNHHFDIIAWFSAGCSSEVLDQREREQILKHRDGGVSLLNLTEGGSGWRHSDETKAKISAANRNNKRPDLADYNRRVKPAAMRGRTLSDETKQKIGLAHKGKAWSKGRIQSPEERQKRSEITRAWWAKKRGGGQ